MAENLKNITQLDICLSRRDKFQHTDNLLNLIGPGSAELYTRLVVLFQNAPIRSGGSVTME